MDICKKIWFVNRINFGRWKNDRRIWIIFFFVAILLIQELRGFTQYGLDTGEKCTAYLLALLFSTPSVSIGSMKMLLYFGCLLMLCDAPFMYQNTLYVVLRSRRNCWWMGECLYILLSTFLYICFITLISTIVILPVATFGESWGEVARNLTYGLVGMNPSEVVAKYKIYLDFPVDSLGYLLPLGVQFYTFFTVWISFLVLGLIQYLVSLVSRSNFLGFVSAGVFVCLDPILGLNTLPSSLRWVQIFSPVCWTCTDNLKMVNQHNFLTIPVVVVMFVVFIVLLLLGIWWFSQRVMITTRKDD